LALNYGDNDITRELLVRLKKGDMLAYDQVYHRYSHKIYSFVLRILKDEADAEDVVQEVFIKIWELREKLDDHKLLNSLIFTIAYNNSISLIRKKISSTKYREHLKIASVFQFQDKPYNDIEFNELNHHVDKLIESLPDRQKQVYLSHREKGLTYPEIAAEMGISKNTVENHMVKTLKYLRQNLKNFMEVTRFLTLYFFFISF
jgi:RNA polymerase sigma-70 factor (ECF subfamily)